MTFSAVLRRTSVLALCLLAAQFAAAANYTQLVFVGTYTEEDSQGIYSFRFDPVTGEMGPVELAAESANPSFLVANASGSKVYAVNELDIFDGSISGAVSVFGVDRATGKLEELQMVASGGAAPAHLSLDKSGRYVLVANYTGGSVAVFAIGQDGTLDKKPMAFVQHTGSSVNKERQKSPHAHEILPTNDNRFVLVADLGIDKLMIYRFDANKGTLTPNQPPSLKVNAGAGPRHFAFSPSGKYLYLLNELSSTITVFSFDPATGKGSKEQLIMTLPKDFSGKNTTAEIQIDAAGTFLYASNRGDDSIVVFAIDPKDGKLSLVQRVPTGGKEPRHFTLDPTGKWLFAANQNSNSIHLFAVDDKTGKLTATEHVVAVPTPVCVLPIALN